MIAISRPGIVAMDGGGDSFGGFGGFGGFDFGGGGGYDFGNSFGDFGDSFGGFDRGNNFSSGLWDGGDYRSWQSEPSDYRSNIADARTEGRTSNYQGTETKFNPDIGKIEPNFLEKAYNYVVDNSGKILPIVGGLVAGPVGAMVGSAVGGYASGQSPEAIIKNAATSYALGGINQLVGQQLAGLGPLAQGAASGAINYGLPSLINTGGVDLGNLGIAAATGGIGREIGAEFGPLAGAAAGTITSGFLRDQDPGDVLGNAALAAAKSELNRETFPGAANLALNAWDYFKPRDFAISDYLPGGTDNIGNIFAQQPSYDPGELDRIQMAVGPRDEVGYVPDSRLIRDYVSSGDGGGGGGRTTAAPSPAPVATAPVTQAPAVQPAPAQDNSDLMAVLLAMGLMDNSGQQAPMQQAPIAAAPMPAFDVNSMFLSSYLGDKNRQPRTMAELLQSLRTA